MVGGLSEGALASVRSVCRHCLCLCSCVCMFFVLFYTRLTWSGKRERQAAIFPAKYKSVSAIIITHSLV